MVQFAGFDDIFYIRRGCFVADDGAHYEIIGRPNRRAVQNHTYVAVAGMNNRTVAHRLERYNDGWVMDDLRQASITGTKLDDRLVHRSIKPEQCECFVHEHSEN